MAEKIFNSYPLKNNIEKQDVGILWNTASSEVDNFTMEKLEMFMLSEIKSKITITTNGILTLNL